MYRGAACFACKQLVGLQNISQQRDISTKRRHQQSISFQNSPILSICLEAFNWQSSAWRCWTRGSITSIPTIIAPRLCNICLPFNMCQHASHYPLYSRPPCIIFNLCFWFRPGISQSLGFERVTDVPPTSASRCSSACHQLEKAMMRIMYFRCTLLQVSAMRWQSWQKSEFCWQKKIIRVNSLQCQCCHSYCDWDLARTRKNQTNRLYSRLHFILVRILITFILVPIEVLCRNQNSKTSTWLPGMICTISGRSIAAILPAMADCLLSCCLFIKKHLFVRDVTQISVPLTRTSSAIAPAPMNMIRIPPEPIVSGMK